MVPGKVRNATGSALQGVHLRLNRDFRGEFSNGNGNFTFADVPDGSYTLSASRVGYEGIVRTITVPLASPLVLVMMEDAALLEEVVIRNIRQTGNNTIVRSLITAEHIATKYVGENAHFFVQNFSPSMITSSQGGNDFSNYGGFRLRGMEDDRVNVTLNGVPLNGMVDYTLYFSNFADLTQSLASIEVQRGVGTSSNGMASYAGSMSLQSKNIFSSQADTIGEIGGTMGSFSSRQLYAAYNTGKKDSGFATYLRASVMGSDGYRVHSGTEAVSFFASSGYQNEQYTFKFTGLTGNTKNEMAYNPILKEAIEKDPRSNPISQNETDDYVQSLAMVEQHYRLNEASIISTTLYYGNARGHYLWGYVSDESDEQIYLQNRHATDQWRVGGMGNVEIVPVDAPYSVRVGGHLYVFARGDTQAEMPDYQATGIQENFVKEEGSLFVKTTYQIGEWSFFTDLQGRRTNFSMQPAKENIVNTANDKFFTQSWFFLSPKIGVSYAPWTSTTLYISAAYTQREPTHNDYVGDDYVLNDNNITAFANKELPAEEVTDVEMGLRYEYKALSVAVNGFLMLFQNEMVPSGEFFPEYYLNVTQSLPNSRRTGVEVEGAWTITPSLRFSLLGTLMQSRINETSSKVTAKTSDPFDAEQSFEAPFSPVHQYMPSLTYQMHGLSVGISGRYLSKAYLGVPNHPDATLPASFVLNGRVSYLFKERYALSIRLNNVLNTLYYTDGSVKKDDNDTYIPSYIVQPPRHVFLQLRIKI